MTGEPSVSTMPLFIVTDPWSGAVAAAPLCSRQHQAVKPALKISLPKSLALRKLFLQEEFIVQIAVSSQERRFRGEVDEIFGSGRGATFLA